MLRSHLAKKLYIRYKPSVSRYGGGRALVCGIVRGGPSAVGSVVGGVVGRVWMANWF